MVGKKRAGKKEKAPLGMPHDFISYTQLITYDRCPRWYKQRYFDKVKGVESEALLYGSFMHSAVRRVNKLIQTLTDKHELGVDEVKKIYDDEYHKNTFSFDIYQRGWTCLLDYAEQTFKQSADIFQCEYEVAIDIADGDKTTKLMGIIDRIDSVEGGLEIIDFKSGALLPSRSEVDNDLQLNIYAALVKKRFPEYRIWTSVWSLGAMRKTKVEKDLTKLDAIEDYVVGLWRKIATDKEFQPKLNSLCYYCPKKCEKYSKLMTEFYHGQNCETIEQVADAFKKVKQNIAILNKEKELLSDRLQNAISDRLGEPLIIDDEEYSLISRHRDSYVVEASDYQMLSMKKIYGKKTKT